MHECNPHFGREMAQIQLPTHTADPIPFFWHRSVSYVVSYYPELLKVKNDEIRFRDEIWPEMVSLT